MGIFTYFSLVSGGGVPDQAIANTLKTDFQDRGNLHS